MSFFTTHLQSILATYKGHPPLSLFLKQYFKSHPKLGSRDRKALTEAVFLYYRCRHFFDSKVSDEEVVRNAYHLCNSKNAFLAKMLSVEQAAETTVQPVFQKKEWFEVSEGLDETRWLQSLWQQPQLFIRLRKNQEQSKQILSGQGIAFDTMKTLNGLPSDCIRIENGKSIESLLPAEDYVVQDWSSQQSIAILLNSLKVLPSKVWDVCSGAGGKSILLKDSLPPFSLLVSDVRKTILHNLKLRFTQYALTGVKSLVINSADATALASSMGDSTFDLVLCDVPCSGSGTWARTPEQFHFYEPVMLQKFIDLQFPIASNASRYVKRDGYLAYITCSVFKSENERVVEKLLALNPLELVHQQIIDGIDDQADCMFVAIFKKG